MQYTNDEIKQLIKRYGFEPMTSETSWDKYGWGWALKESSTVYLRKVGDTRIWIGELDEDKRRFVCEVEHGCDLEGQWDGDNYYEALLNGLIDTVIRIAVKEMWDEPKQQGLKYCCEDVINAAATYGAQVLYYGFERLPELFPHSPEGVLTTPDELELYDALIGEAIEYVKFDCERMNGRLGIEFEDVWS